MTLYSGPEIGTLQAGLAQQEQFARPMGIVERLRVKKEMLERDLVLVNEALAALEDNEEIARAVEAISKVGHF